MNTCKYSHLQKEGYPAAGVPEGRRPPVLRGGLQEEVRAACSGFILSVSQPSVQLSSRAVNEASRSFTVPIENGLLLVKSV